MPEKIKLKNVRAGDPGIGFTLDVSGYGEPISKGMKLTIDVTDGSYTSRSIVKIERPVTDSQLYFVVPFGDANYEAAKSLDFTLTIAIPQDGDGGLFTEQHTGAVLATGPHLTYRANLTTGLVPGHTLPQNGMLASANGQYEAIMQKDGNFVVYETYTPDNNANIPTDASYSQQEPPYTPDRFELKWNQGNNQVIVYDKQNSRSLAASPGNINFSVHALIITKRGQFAFRATDEEIHEIEIRPGNV